MTNYDLGFNAHFVQASEAMALDSFELARVALVHKERYVLKNEQGEVDAELMGHLRFTAESSFDLPALGDWVAYVPYDENKGLIHRILPRRTVLERKAVAKQGQAQIIAANIDYGLIVQAVDRDFNLNRVERYLTICHAAGVLPILVLTKVDLMPTDVLQSNLTQIDQRLKGLSVVTVSSETIGYDALAKLIKPGYTYCLLGSSGVGKSTILNALIGQELMPTSSISSAVNKGRHTTTHRELVLLEQGGVIVDNPGMREVGLTDAAGGLELTFDAIMDYAQDCRYSDCTHLHEQGCAVLAALEHGDIDPLAYDNFCKMQREKSHYESDVQDRKKKAKDLGRRIREVKKHQRDNNL